MACLYPSEESQTPSEPSQCLVLQVIDGEVDTERAREDPSDAWVGSLPPEAPLSQLWAFSISRNSGVAPERPRGRRKTALPSVHQQEHNGDQGRQLCGLG